MNAYESTKESFLPWVGKIPTHWKITRMKNILQNVSEKNHPDATVLSLYREYGVLPKNSRDDNHNVTSLDTASYKFVRIGELVINKMKAWQGSVGISDYEGIVSPAYYVCKFITDDVDKKYFHYLLRCKTYAQEFERLSTGMRIGQWDLGINDFMCIPALIPPKSEQTAIAKYLDDQYAKINALIAEVKESIEEYKQCKASLIFEAVTKGLDPNAEMRDSGVKWIVKIPTHWNIVRLKDLFSFSKGLPITKSDLSEVGIPVVSYGQIHAKTNTGTHLSDDLLRYVPSKYLESNADCLIKYGDIVLADTSEDLTGLGNAVLMDRTEPVFAGYHTIIMHPINVNNSKYISYLLRTDCWRFQLRSNASGIKVFSATQKMLKTCNAILPPIKEQKSIVDYLDKKCSAIDEIISGKTAVIENMTKYKQSLVYEVVTGKRKVVQTVNETERHFEEYIESYLTSDKGGWSKATDAGY